MNEEREWDREKEKAPQKPAEKSADPSEDIAAWLCETRELVDHNGC